MIVIGERINATRPSIAQALAQRKRSVLAREARRQTEAGADFIDVNAGGDPSRELEDLAWALSVVQESTDLPLCIDSASSEALGKGLELVQRRPVMLNSVTAEERKLGEVLPLAARSGAALIALAMDERGVPDTAEQRVENAARLVAHAEQAGIPADRLYIDPCIQPISTDAAQGHAVLAAVWRIRRQFPQAHLTCGLSNISFGLPRRPLLNRTYLACLIFAGLDSALMDPTAEGIMEAVRAAEALAGLDEYCIRYIRSGRR